LRCSSAGSATS